MKKIKAFIAAFIGVFACATAVKANAAEQPYGVYNVTTTTNANDTATWDYSGISAKKEFSETPVVLTGGISVAKAGNTGKKVKVDTDANKGGYLDVYCGSSQDIFGHELSIPVPVGSAGKITITTLDSKVNRRLYLDSINGAPYVESNNKGASLDFTSDMITEGYLVFGAINESGTSKDETGTNREVKIKSIKVTLTTGAYEASAANRKITFYDGSTVLKEEIVAEGSETTFKPVKWGYDVEGVYTEPEFTNKVTLPLTAGTTDVNLYVKFTKWTDFTVQNEDILDFDLISKGVNFYGEDNAPGEVQLTETFTLLSKCKFGTGTATCGDLGTSGNVIKTGGKLEISKEAGGIKINATKAGTLTVWAKTGSNGDVRDITLYQGETQIGTYNTSDDATEFTFDIPAAGTYYLGSEKNGITIWYVSLTEQPQQSVTLTSETGYNADGTELVRVIFTVENTTEEAFLEQMSNYKIVVKGTTKLTEGFDFTQYFTTADKLVTSTGEVFKTYDKKDNTFYFACVIAVSNTGTNGEAYKNEQLTFGLYDSENQLIDNYEFTYTVLGHQAQ